MKSRLLLAAASVAALAIAPIYPAMPQSQVSQVQSITGEPREVHLKNIKQLTNGGENAEAYFSLDGQEIIFQSTREPYKCDQIFTMNADGSNQKMISTGRGRVTCGYFTPDKKRIIYASTHLGSADCPMPPNMSEGYVWAIYPSFDIAMHPRHLTMKASRQPLVQVKTLFMQGLAANDPDFVKTFKTGASLN